ncbi:MAG TPA: hypothetical protein ENF52_05860, partial [Chloroflexi bacterium]|nr:hypothetical protein [Chloroflexota bacterium]
MSLQKLTSSSSRKAASCRRKKRNQPKPHRIQSSSILKPNLRANSLQMESVGVWLRQARERLDATLEDVEAATHIRERFIKALEAGDFTAFPGGEVQIRGFLRIYARYLGLPAEEALSRYEAEARWGEA